MSRLGRYIHKSHERVFNPTRQKGKDNTGKSQGKLNFTLPCEKGRS
jgi:hypothetical protein